MNHMMNGANIPNGIPAGMAPMNNGVNGVAPRIPGEGDADFKTRLNTYIYDYMLRNEQYECARTMLSSSLSIHTKPVGSKKRPNGMDDSMDTDSKDNVDLKRPADLPEPDKILDAAFENSFLLDWFTLFWEIFLAPRTNLRPQKLNPNAITYMAQNREQSRLRSEQQSNLLRQPGGMAQAGMQQQYGNMMRMGMQRNQRMPANMQGLTTQQQQQVFVRQQLAVQQQQQQQQQHMERSGSEVDMNGQRPRTPTGENTPSPLKKPRLEGPQFAGFQMQNGRMLPMMPGQHPGTCEQQFLMHDVTDPIFAGSQQLSNFQNQSATVQKKSLDIYSQTLAQLQRANMPVPTMANQGTAMMQNGMEINPDFYANGGQQMRAGMPQGGVNGQGNHALQDYQMQLMLLEQQNKKRLLMARQEQDNLRPDQQGNMGGQQAFAPGMSPQGSRSGPSPNPSDQMKRGTPKMGQAGLPASPMPDGTMHGRGSPGAMNFNNNMPMDMMPNMKMGEGMQMGPNGANMRPPSSNPHQFQGNTGMPQQQLDIMRQQAANARMPNGGANWQQGQPGQPGQPPAPQVSQAGPIGTPQQRTAAMPPPQNVPAAGNPVNGRAPSPAPSATATTPQTTNKANPKKGKGDKEPRKRPNKKNTATTATPSADADNPTPTAQPQTPITPMHQKFDGKVGQASSSITQAAAPAPAPVPPVPQQQPDENMMSQFADMDGALNVNSSDVDMTFGALDSDEVLNQFDFDQFITEGSAQDFDLSAFGSYDAGELGTGDA